MNYESRDDQNVEDFELVLLKISDWSSSETGYINIIDSLGTCIWTFQTFNQLADNVHPDPFNHDYRFS